MPEQEKQVGEVAASNWLEEAASKTETPVEKPVETEAETPSEPQAKEKVEDKVEKVVPLAALHEERAKRREALAAQTQLKQEIEQLRRQQVEWMQRQQQPQAVPDPANDPVGALIHKQDQTAAQLEQMRQDSLRQQHQNYERQNFENFVATVRAQSEEFRKEQPDADDAVGFLKKGRVEEYKAMGMTHQEAVRSMTNDEFNLSQWALQNGENPAAVAYRMAEARGYVAPAKKLEMQSRGQNATMPNGSGKGAGSIPSLEALLKMDSKEFGKATDGDNWAKLMKKHGA